jgi:hypothetical protein
MGREGKVVNRTKCFCRLFCADPTYSCPPVNGDGDMYIIGNEARS